LAFNEKDNAGAFPVVADYMIAWSLIETGMKNQAPDAANDGASGPFAIGDKEWKSYMDSGASDSGASNEIRVIPNLHAYAAAFLAHDQMQRFSDLNSVADAPDGPFIPSYLNVFHSQLLGVAVASECQKRMVGGQEDALVNAVIEEVVTDAAERQKLLERRRKYLNDGATPRTVQVFFVKTANLLDANLVKAHALIKEHFPEVIPTPEALSGDAPWYAAAETEWDFWRDNNITDGNPAGAEKVVRYFRETDSGITTVKAWCGAFVAFCLSEAGAEPEESIIKESARAANWKSWGNTELRLRARSNSPNTSNEVPKGAIVVTVPLAKGASGHVGFFSHNVDADRVEILGGNQSSRVSKMTIKRDKIVAIRWQDFTPQNTDATDTTPVSGSPVNATEADVLILARTLFGEASNQSTKGIEAVANVVSNRVKDRRWPDTISKVCLQNKQFSCWNRNDPNFRRIRDKVPGSSSDFDKCFAIARRAVAAGFPDHVDGATHYYANYISTPSWVRKSPNARKTATIGVHIFYAGIK
jgi:uncharacterized protein (TIGR02594 family)